MNNVLMEINQIKDFLKMKSKLSNLDLRNEENEEMSNGSINSPSEFSQNSQKQNSGEIQTKSLDLSQRTSDFVKDYLKKTYKNLEKNEEYS